MLELHDEKKWQIYCSKKKILEVKYIFKFFDTI